jgi:hypothetical protein
MTREETEPNKIPEGTYGKIKINDLNEFKIFDKKNIFFLFNNS